MPAKSRRPSSRAAATSAATNPPRLALWFQSQGVMVVVNQIGAAESIRLGDKMVAAYTDIVTEDSAKAALTETGYPPAQPHFARPPKMSQAMLIVGPSRFNHDEVTTASAFAGLATAQRKPAYTVSQTDREGGISISEDHVVMVLDSESDSK